MGIKCPNCDNDPMQQTQMCDSKDVEEVVIASEYYCENCGSYWTDNGRGEGLILNQSHDPEFED